MLLLRTEQGNHLVSILCGLVGAIVLVFLVIVVTMKVRIGVLTVFEFTGTGFAFRLHFMWQGYYKRSLKLSVSKIWIISLGCDGL